MDEASQRLINKLKLKLAMITWTMNLKMWSLSSKVQVCCYVHTYMQVLQSQWMLYINIYEFSY